jgi:hypothetical protein
MSPARGKGRCKKQEQAIDATAKARPWDMAAWWGAKPLPMHMSDAA